MLDGYSGGGPVGQGCAEHLLGEAADKSQAGDFDAGEVFGCVLLDLQLELSEPEIEMPREVGFGQQAGKQIGLILYGGRQDVKPHGILGKEMRA